MARRVLLAALLSLAVLSACDSKQNHAAPRTAPTVAASGAVVPGGAAAEAPPGSPAFCAALTHSAAIRGIGDAMGQLAADNSTATGATRLNEAAADLRALSGDASPSLHQSLNGAADALSHLADAGAKDSSAIDAVSQALGRLGNEVQATCHFPVG